MLNASLTEAAGVENGAGCPRDVWGPHGAAPKSSSSGSASREETRVAVAGDAGARDEVLQAGGDELPVGLRTDRQLPFLAGVEVVEARVRADRVRMRGGSRRRRLAHGGAYRRPRASDLSSEGRAGGDDCDDGPGYCRYEERLPSHLNLHVV